MDSNEKFYSIGEVAKLTHLSQQTIRYYDQINLIVPEMRCSDSGYRYYTEQQVILLMIIRRLRDTNCSIKDIHKIINEKQLDELYRLLYQQNLELEEKIKNMSNMINSNNMLIDHIAKAIMISDNDNTAELNKEKNFMIEEIPAVPLFSIRQNHPDYNIERTSLEHWSELYDECEKLQLKIIGPPIATFYTELLGQFIMRDCDFAIALPVEPKEGCDQIQKSREFTAATAIHKGSYATMIETYILLLQWINKSGYEANTPASEEFLISPIECLEPDMLITKIMIPVTKAKSRHRAK